MIRIAKQSLSFIILASALAEACCAEPIPPVLSAEEQAPYIRLADAWAKRLWTGMDYYVCGNPFSNRKPQWYPLQKYRPDLYTSGRASAVCKDPAGPGSDFFDVFVYRSFEPIVDSKTVATSRELCVHFFGRSEKVTSISNPLYRQHDVPYLPYILGQPYHPPLHTSEEAVKAKMSEYAAMFGVHNLWDNVKFKQRKFQYEEGVWIYDGHFYTNGLATPYSVGLEVADLPGMPLGYFVSSLDWCPTNLPSRAVLSSGQAASKAEEYLKKYFPFKEVASRMVYDNNNWLMYVKPNYNYIHPSSDYGVGISDYVPKRDEVRLAYIVSFESTDKEDYPRSAFIYVDAVTGEMIGGLDFSK
ncbi:MAG: hypothetical protein ACOX7Q_16655 [Kiritimatiellia bacterium]|jgi:hypothetical protein